MTNKQQISISILLVGIMAMMFPAHAVSGQIFLTNEQQSLQSQPQQLDPGFMSFEQFMQYMFYYEKMFGKDYVTKIYKEYHNDDDDDDDDDDKKRHYHKDWWKDNSKDHDWWKDYKNIDKEEWKDMKGYCAGKGEWNGKKCVTDNDDDKGAWEDAVCDNRPESKSKLCAGPSSKDKDKDKQDKDNDVDSIEEANEKLNDLFSNDNNDENDDNNNNNNDVKEQDNEEEQDEPEEDDSNDDEEEDDSGGDDDNGDGGSEEE